LNDKFLHEARNANKDLKNSKNIEADIQSMTEGDYEYMLEKIGERAAKFKKTHFISSLFNKQNEDGFANPSFGARLPIIFHNLKKLAGASVRLCLITNP